MAKKRKIKNPLLFKKYNEGFNDGIKHAAKTIALNFEGIEDIPGIGPKTAKKIREHVLNKTFNKKEQKNESIQRTRK